MLTPVGFYLVFLVLIVRSFRIPLLYCVVKKACIHALKWCIYGCLAFLSFRKFCRLWTSRPELASSLGSDPTQEREKESAEGPLRVKGVSLSLYRSGQGGGHFCDSERPAGLNRLQGSPNSRVGFACLVTSIWMINGLNLFPCHLIPPALNAMTSDLDSQTFPTPRGLWGWAHMCVLALPECCNFLDPILFICSTKAAVRTADSLGAHFLDDYWIAVS